MPDVINLLEADHRAVEDLFAKAETTTGAAKAQVVAKIATELTLHTEVEEQVVYPAMRDAGLDDLVDEAEAEHQTVKSLLARLEPLDGTSADVDPVIAEIKANVQHHVQEEESDVFPKFRSATDQSTLDSLGDQVEKLKQSNG
jgi:hemerythrin superfamily protein